MNSQWRKVQDRLEDDERCSRLEKIDRLLSFQDYIRDLEKEEEEQKKIQKVVFIQNDDFNSHLAYVLISFCDQL